MNRIVVAALLVATSVLMGARHVSAGAVEDDGSIVLYTFENPNGVSVKDDQPFVATIPAPAAQEGNAYRVYLTMTAKATQGKKLTPYFKGKEATVKQYWKPLTRWDGDEAAPRELVTLPPAETFKLEIKGKGKVYAVEARAIEEPADARSMLAITHDHAVGSQGDQYRFYVADVMGVTVNFSTEHHDEGGPEIDKTYYDTKHDLLVVRGVEITNNNAHYTYAGPDAEAAPIGSGPAKVLWFATKHGAIAGLNHPSSNNKNTNKAFAKAVGSYLVEAQNVGAMKPGDLEADQTGDYGLIRGYWKEAFFNLNAGADTHDPHTMEAMEATFGIHREFPPQQPGESDKEFINRYMQALRHTFQNGPTCAGYGNGVYLSRYDATKTGITVGIGGTGQGKTEVRFKGPDGKVLKKVTQASPGGGLFRLEFDELANVPLYVYPEIWIWFGDAAAGVAGHYHTMVCPPSYPDDPVVNRNLQDIVKVDGTIQGTPNAMLGARPPAFTVSNLPYYSAVIPEGTTMIFGLGNAAVSNGPGDDLEVYMPTAESVGSAYADQLDLPYGMCELMLSKVPEITPQVVMLGKIASGGTSRFDLEGVPGSDGGPYPYVIVRVPPGDGAVAFGGATTLHGRLVDGFGPTQGTRLGRAFSEAAMGDAYDVVKKGADAGALDTKGEQRTYYVFGKNTSEWNNYDVQTAFKWPNGLEGLTGEAFSGLIAAEKPGHEGGKAVELVLRASIESGYSLILRTINGNATKELAVKLLLAGFNPSIWHTLRLSLQRDEELKTVMLRGSLDGQELLKASGSMDEISSTGRAGVVWKTPCRFKGFHVDKP